MKVRQLKDLGLEQTFVPAEKSGTNPLFYLERSVESFTLISGAVDMSFEENDDSFIDDYLDKEISCQIFDTDIDLTDSEIIALSNIIERIISG